MQTETQENEKLLLRVTDAAQQIGVCRTTIYNLIQQGNLGHVLIGKSIRIPKTELQAWVNRQPVIYGRESSA